jgi:peptidoglycan/LPS O-acetylase OafA/YrhL
VKWLPKPAVDPMARTMLVQQNETVAAPPRRRLTGLDGLRGVAALAVVVSHILGTTPAFIDPASGSVAWWLSYTPISLLWNGKEAVIVFFVLSGFVLSRPFLRSTSPSWRAYYPRRLVRLYLPMWGALLFTAVMTFLVARHGMAGSSLWTNGHVNRTGGYVGQDAVLPHIGDTFDGPLWSLRWEVLFSLGLPLYVVLARSFRTSALTRTLVVVGILVLGVVDIKTHSIGLRNAVLYLPMFGVGVLMAAYETPLLRAGRFVVERSRWLLAAVIAAAVVLADSSLEVYALRSHYSGAVTTLCHGAGVVGAAMLIWLVLSWPPLERTLDRRSTQWVGKRSFSLYLTHEPVLVALALLLGGHPNVGVMLVVGIPAALLVAAGFYVAVERPSHRLANAVGRRIGRSGPTQPPTQPPSRTSREAVIAAD